MRLASTVAQANTCNTLSFLVEIRSSAHEGIRTPTAETLSESKTNQLVVLNSKPRSYYGGGSAQANRGQPIMIQAAELSQSDTMPQALCPS